MLTIGCNDKKSQTENPKTSLTESGMKCGAGKYGASTGKCGNATEDITMKCGAGKCGTGMSTPKVPSK